jgi:RNA polymerase sigma-70 factor (ECF subfamily)
MDESNTKSDEEIVALTLKGRDNFAILIERYQARLSRYIARLCSCTIEDIEDLLQEIFIKTYRNLNDFDGGLKFSSWIYRITHNEVISHFRKLKSRPQGVDVDLALLPDASSKEFIKSIDRNIDKTKILEVLQSLDIKYREILVLRFFEQKDYLEISDILKKPGGTVATLLSRAKKQFKEKAEKNNIKFEL